MGDRGKNKKKEKEKEKSAEVKNILKYRGGVPKHTKNSGEKDKNSGNQNSGEKNKK